jgi:3-oxoacyl-(acyl-carrier-protein) synthase
MKGALADAALSAADIGAIFANASGLPEDAVEAKAIEEVLGAGKLVTATRAGTGHAAAAAGAVDVATAALSLSLGVVPGTAGCATGDAIVKLVREPLKAELGAVLVNACTFGGQTASLILKRYAK